MTSLLQSDSTNPSYIQETSLIDMLQESTQNVNNIIDAELNTFFHNNPDKNEVLQSQAMEESFVN